MVAFLYFFTTWWSGGDICVYGRYPVVQGKVATAARANVRIYSLSIDRWTQGKEVVRNQSSKR